MKARKRIALALVGMVSIASAQSSVTLGTFGFQQVDIPPAGGVNLVGFSFSSSSPLYLADVFGADQLTQSTLLPTLADLIYIWNGASYDIYFQKTDGLFYDGSDPFGAPTTTEIQTGTAIFLQSPSGAVQTNTITLSGTVLMTDSESQVYDGLITIANPYPSEMDLNSTNFNWSAATSGFLPTLADNVFIWNPNKTGGAGYDVYFLKSDGKWYEGVSPFPLGNAVIPAGGGAFYQARNSFTNELVRPFPSL
jgi:hypothetical protein